MENPQNGTQLQEMLQHTASHTPRADSSLKPAFKASGVSEQQPGTALSQASPPSPPSLQRSSASPQPHQPVPITLRAPGSPPPPSFHGPPPSWLAGTWHISHSTLPTWRGKRNVRITYTLPRKTHHNGNGNHAAALDDKVEFDPVLGGAIKSVSGRQVAREESDGNGAGADPEDNEVVRWDWHGKGLIRAAHAEWEVLGWGDAVPSDASSRSSGSGSGADDEAGEAAWAVTFFRKTAMTPEGVNVYVRSRATATEAFVEGVRAALRETGDERLRRLAGEMYEVESG